MPARCPGCQSVFNLSPDLHGATIRCRQCQQVFTVQAPKSPPKVPVVSPVDDVPRERRIQTRPVPARQSVPAVRARESRPPARPKKSSSGGVGAVAIVGIGALILGVLLIGLLGVGGVAYFALRDTSSASQTGASASLAQASGIRSPAPNRSRPRSAPSKDGQLSQEMLDYLKGLMAYIKVEGGNQSASGSGFLIKVDGNTGYFITNHHVVTLDPEEVDQGRGPGQRFPRMGPRMPFGPQGGIPQMPGLPPIFERPTMTQAVKARVTVVLGSGTAAERSFPAEVIDADEGRDLALLKINAPNLPANIDLADRAELKETAPVFTVGFPFGQMLALNRSPEVSIGKATITSVRRGKKDRATLVQLQGDLNPGNSGGPVVDADGRLVGIAVAHIPGTQIGLAIAPDILEEMLHRSKASIKLNIVKRERDECTVEFVVEVLDLFDSLAEIRLLFAPGSLAPRDAAEQKDGGFAPLANARTLMLSPAGHRYSGQLTVSARELTNSQLPVQMQYIERDGSTHFGKPRNHLISFTGRTPNFDAAFPEAGQNTSIEAGLSNGRFFMIRLRRPGFEMLLRGTVDQAVAKATSIRIVDGRETITATSIENVPDNYKGQVEALLQHKQLQDLIHPPQTKKPAEQIPMANESEKVPPVTNIFAGGQVAYLTQLKEFGVKNGAWPVTKDGTTGAPDQRRIKVGGNPSEHGMGMHPPGAPQFACAKYRLGNQAARFKATVAIDDTANFCFTPAIFTVWGDGKKLFESKNIAHNHFRTQECSVDVAGVDVLEIRVHSIGHNSGVHAVWVEPRLLQKADTADIVWPVVKKLFETGSTDYLSDLSETVIKSGPWPFSKNGEVGNGSNQITVGGKKSLKGLGMHPPNHGSAIVRYTLDKKASVFKGAVAIDDSKIAVFGSAVFEVYGDGKQLWQSATVNGEHLGPDDFEINVSGVTELELRVVASGSSHGVHAVWIEPQLIKHPGSGKDDQADRKRIVE